MIRSIDPRTHESRFRTACPSGPWPRQFPENPRRLGGVAFLCGAALALNFAVYGRPAEVESPSVSAEATGERPAGYLLTPEPLAEGERASRTLAPSSPQRAEAVPRVVRIAEANPPSEVEDPNEKPPAGLLTPESLAEGKRTFLVHCTTCHGQDAGGGLGPSLTDKETLHGGRFVDMLSVIANGVELKGMPRWIGLLDADRVAQVAAYVYTLKGTSNRKSGSIRFSVILLAPAAGVLGR
jgi:mono/diheme cytochrome c family protein